MTDHPDDSRVDKANQFRSYFLLAFQVKQPLDSTMSITIGLKRKRQCIIMAIDKSGSMNGARMDAAKEGASMVLNELLDGDLAAVKVFNDKVKDLSDGVTEIDSASKRTLCSRIQSITADGMTSLYDVTLASGLEILKTSAQVQAFEGRAFI